MTTQDGHEVQIGDVLYLYVHGIDEKVRVVQLQPHGTWTDEQEWTVSNPSGDILNPPPGGRYLKIGDWILAINEDREMFEMPAAWFRKTPSKPGRETKIATR